MWFKWFLIIRCVIDVGVSIQKVGTPQLYNPALKYTSNNAIGAMIGNALIIAGILYYWP